MEDHFLSPKKKQASPLSPQGTATQLDSFHDHVSLAEESGWTTYLEDFSKQRSQYSYCSNFATSSLVSDAATKFSGGGGDGKKLSLIKKMRIKQKNDEDLEDTASSPVHSPKVPNDFKRMEMKKVNECHGHSVGPFFEHEKRDGTVFSGPNHEYTSLKKRGLCVVPLSLFSNYIG